jgi:hypothetical protein
MKQKKPVALALLIMLIGGALLIGKIGIHPGGWISLLFSWLLPVAIIGVGYLVLKRGSLVGWLIGAFGIIALIAKLGSIIMVLIAVALIMYGGSLLFQRRNRS